MPEHEISAVAAIGRLMAMTVGGAAPAAVRRALAREARNLLGAEAALLVAVETSEGVAQVVAADPDAGSDHPRVPIRRAAPLQELIELRRPSARAGGDQ